MTPSPDMPEELVERLAWTIATDLHGGPPSNDLSAGRLDFEDVIEVIKRRLENALPSLADIERQALERAAKVARRYAERPLGNSVNNTREALDNGMDYSTGSADTASIIALRIKALIPQPEERTDE